MKGAARPGKRAALSRFSERAGRLPGVEIFSAGVHRGKEYTRQDLHDILRNFRQYSTGPNALVEVPAVLGHEETQEFLERTDLPAAAWADALKVEDRYGKDGQKRATLVADFDNCPPEVNRLLRGRRYKTVSAEIYDQPPDGVPGRGKMLRRVAFLGGDIPQIKTLRNIPVPEAHAEERTGYWPVVLKFSEARRHSKIGTFFVFSEVTQMDRAALLKQLGEAGVDTSLLTEAVPDAVLAEMVRVLADQGDSFDDEPANDEEKKAMQDQVKKMAEKCGLKLAEAPPPVPADKTPATMTPEMSSYVEKCVNKAVAATVAKYDEQIKVLEGRSARIAKFSEDREREGKRASIDATIKSLQQEGKILPAELDGGLVESLLLLDAQTVHKFSDKSEGTLLDRELKRLKNRPQLLKYAERFADPKSTDTVGKKAKLEKFHDDNHAGFEAVGTSKDEFVKTWEKASDEDIDDMMKKSAAA